MRLLLANAIITLGTVAVVVVLAGAIVVVVTRDERRRWPDPTTAGTLDRGWSLRR